MAEWAIVRLEPHHVTAGFECGLPSVDQFIQTRALYRKTTCRTHVAVPAAGHDPASPIAGFFSLATSRIEYHALPSKVRRDVSPHPVPTVLIAQLGVDRRHKGKGLGTFLLADAVKKIIQISEEVAYVALAEVDAATAEAAAFYQKYGFVEMPDQTAEPRKMYLRLPSLG